jgi:hypothetical protein
MTAPPTETTKAPAQAGHGEGNSMGTVFITTVTILFATSVFTGSEWLMAVTNVVVGVQVEGTGPPAGVINITLGVLLLLDSWNRRRRRKRKGAAAVGARSMALRDALARNMWDRVIPVPA